jgi:hypothetical protein
MSAMNVYLLNLSADVWRLQNLNEKEQLRKFFYGLVCSRV